MESEDATHVFMVGIYCVDANKEFFGDFSEGFALGYEFEVFYLPVGQLSFGVVIGVFFVGDVYVGIKIILAVTHGTDSF